MLSWGKGCRYGFYFSLASLGLPFLGWYALILPFSHIPGHCASKLRKHNWIQLLGYISWECECVCHKGWVLKNWCFRIVVLKKTLESTLDCKEIQPVNLKINPEYSLEGLMLKLKLQYFDHLMRRADSLEKTLILEKIEGKRRKEWQRMRWLESIPNSMDMNLSRLHKLVVDRGT